MEIAIRSREHLSDGRFLQDFKNAMSRELRIGNFYLRGIKSYNQINAETDFTFGQTSDVRIRTGMMLFFLVNIMLCVMGTFWYRIRVRRDEVGLRMAMGSTRTNIRKMQFISSPVNDNTFLPVKTIWNGTDKLRQFLAIRIHLIRHRRKQTADYTIHHDHAQILSSPLVNFNQ